MEIDPTPIQSIKIVTVGDHLVGKSCAITTYHSFKSAILRLVHLSNVTLLSSIALLAILKLTDQIINFRSGIL